MSKNNNFFRLAVPPALKSEIPYVLYNFLLQVVSLLNGRISLGNKNNSNSSGNVSGRFITVKTPPVAGDAFTVKHDLGYVPYNYIIVNADQNYSNIYEDSSLKATVQDITFRVETENVTMTIWIF